MTNREYLLKTAEFDVLCQMQKNLETAAFHVDCILTCIDGEDNNYERRDYCNKNCTDCIATWLNEERK